MSGKGSKPRPCNKDLYDPNFDDINWKKSDDVVNREVKIIKSKIGLVKRIVYKSTTQ